MAAVKFQTQIQNHLSFGLSSAHLCGQLHCQARVWLCNLKKDIPLFNLPQVMGIGQAACLQQENGENKIIYNILYNIYNVYIISVFLVS